MEDATISETKSLNNGEAFFGVYDGHGGSWVSKYTEDTLVDILKDLPSFKKQDYKTAFQDVYRKIDQQLKTANLEKYGSDESGTPF